MKSIFSRIVFVGIILVTQVHAEPIDNNAPIDKEIIRHEDITGDGIPEEIKIKLKAKNLMSPMEWSLTIKSKGETIYHKHQKDSRQIDERFTELESDTCYKARTVLECKRNFYFNSLGVHIIREDGYDKNGIVEIPSYPINGIINRYKVSRKKAENIYRRARNQILEGTAVLVVFETSPIQTSYPLEMYIKELGGFITIYED